MFKNSVINIEISDDIEQSLIFAKSNGFEAIEIHSAWGKNIETMNKDELKKLNRMVKKHALKVSCISSTLFLRCFLDNRTETVPEIRAFQTISGDYTFHLKSLIHAFHAADILGAPIIRVFGFQKEPELIEETFSLAVERFLLPAEMAKKAGFILAMENCPFTSFGWGKNAARLVKKVDSKNLRLLWDPAGGVRAGEPDCIQAMSTIIPLLAHVHAKDFLPNSNNGGRYLKLGQGIVPWNIILQELVNKKYEGAISLEPHFRGSDGSKTSAILESQIALQEIISNLAYPNK